MHAHQTQQEKDHLHALDIETNTIFCTSTEMVALLNGNVSATR